MLHSLGSAFGQAAVERMTLLANHVLGSEPVAMQRLKPHAGRSIQLHFLGWPRVLPPLPTTRFRVTNAGLLEWCAPDRPDAPDTPPQADLRVEVEASNPAWATMQAITGERPKVVVAGDAAFATDLNWLIDNLRWDVQDDLARLIGQGPAREVALIASGVAAGLRDAARAFSRLAAHR